MVVGPETKTGYAREGQQQFTGLHGTPSSVTGPWKNSEYIPLLHKPRCVTKLTENLQIGYVSYAGATAA
jgi:hypothetical protein